MTKNGKNHHILRKSSVQPTVRDFEFTSAVLFLLEVIVMIVCVQLLHSKWSELVAAWPYEMSFCIFIGFAFVGMKISQMMTFGARPARIFWMTFFIAMSTVAVLTCGLFACRLVKYKSFGISMFTNTMFLPKAAIDKILAHRRFTKNILFGDDLYAFDQYHLHSMLNYDKMEAVKFAWDSVQIKYECCGSSIFNDWYKVRGEIPQSCCKNSMNSKCKRDEAFRTPCGPKLHEILFQQINCIEMTIFLLMALEIILSIMTAICTLVCPRAGEINPLNIAVNNDLKAYVRNDLNAQMISLPIAVDQAEGATV